jgi:hypothetical protein
MQAVVNQYLKKIVKNLLVTSCFPLTDYSPIGILQLHPGAINSIPSKSHLEIGKNLFLSIQFFS